MSDVISAKVPKKLKQKARRYKIRISRIVREALEKEVRRAEEEHLSEQIATLRSNLRNRLRKKDIIQAVRTSRDER